MPRQSSICAYCGTTFAPTTWHQQFCSRRCATTARPHPRKPVRERFDSKVDRHAGHWWGGVEGWRWTGYCHKSGYGYLYIAGRPVVAHRVAWELHRGPVPIGMLVLHHCDVRDCVNPAHCFIGTHADNAADMMSKGRHGVTGTPGERHPQALLTETQVREIRARRAAGERLAVLARDFGIAESTVSAVATRRLWKHVA